MKKYFFSMLFLSAASYMGAVSVYEDVNVLPLNMWGWFGNAPYISALIKQYKPKVVVELGSWLGVSTAFIADNMTYGGIVYAIDVWEETPECKDAMSIHMGKSDKEVKELFNNLYQHFLSNMIHSGLTNKVFPVKMKTVPSANMLNINPELVYVDASHAEEDVYRDIMAWYPKLVKGGIMCGDDWSWPTVRAGVERVAKDLNQNVKAENNFWWFDPKF